MLKIRKCSEILGEIPAMRTTGSSLSKSTRIFSQRTSKSSSHTQNTDSDNWPSFIQ